MFGESLTKITICFLVTFIVMSVIGKWLVGGTVAGAKEIVPLLAPIVITLITVYGSSKTIQKRWQNGTHNEPSIKKDMSHTFKKKR